MNMHGPDWQLWRSFSAVVSAGSLSGAARAIGLSQPTLGRHVEALERSLGATLFERTLSGLKPNEVGLRLFEQVGVAERALAEAQLLAEGQQAELSGSVRITASEVTAHYTLPAIFAILRREFPAISLELVPTDSPENILLREADIAIRMFRPTQLELIARKIGVSPLIACAHESYLAANGVPQSFNDLRGHEIVGFDRSELLINGARALGFMVTREDFHVRTDSQTAIWEMVKAGLGIGFAQDIIVQATPGLVALLPGLAIPPLEVYLTTHRELFTSRKIRAIYDRIAELLSRYYRGEPLKET